MRPVWLAWRRRVTLIVRVVRTLGTEQRFRDLVLVAVPASGCRLDLRSWGAGLARVEEVLFLPRGEAVGFLPPGVVLILAAEPPEGLEAATGAGWRPLTLPEPVQVA